MQIGVTQNRFYGGKNSKSGVESAKGAEYSAPFDREQKYFPSAHAGFIGVSRTFRLSLGGN